MASGIGYRGRPFDRQILLHNSKRFFKNLRRCGSLKVVKLTAVLEPAKERGYTCFVEEIPAGDFQG